MNQFKKFILLPFALAGTPLASTAAMAQSAPASGAYTGSVVVAKGIALSCDITLNVNAGLNVVGMSFATIPGSLSDPRCNLLTFDNLPYNYAYGLGQFNIYGAYINTITIGDCAGDIGINWDGTTFTIQAVIPAAIPGTPDCTIDGTAF